MQSHPCLVSLLYIPSLYSKTSEERTLGTVAFVLSSEVVLFSEVAFFLASKCYSVCLINILMTLCYKIHELLYANLTDREILHIKECTIKFEESLGKVYIH